MRQITEASRHRLEEWWDRAINTPHVRRFMSVDPDVGPVFGVAGDWEGACYLSDGGSALLRVRLARSAQPEAMISTWCLHTNRQRRAWAVGHCLRHLRTILRTYNVRAFGSCVHATNAEALALNRKRLGEPWGVQPQGAWDALEGRYVDLRHFQRVLA